MLHGGGIWRGEERGSSSHSRYYRTQPTGHEYIIYDVIYVLEFLRALSKKNPQHPTRPVRVFLTYPPTSLQLSCLDMCYAPYERATTFWKSDVTHDRGEVPCWRRRGERKFKGMVGEGWILDRVYIYNKSHWNRNNLSPALRYSCLYSSHQLRRKSTLTSCFYLYL